MTQVIRNEQVPDPVKKFIKFMDANGYEFIIMVKGCKDLVSSLILEIRGSFEDEWENSIPYYDVSGITIKDYVLPKDERERYIHIYYSDFRKAKERTKLSALTN